PARSTIAVVGSHAPTQLVRPSRYRRRQGYGRRDEPTGIAAPGGSPAEWIAIVRADRGVVAAHHKTAADREDIRERIRPDLNFQHATVVPCAVSCLHIVGMSERQFGRSWRHIEDR